MFSLEQKLGNTYEEQILNLRDTIVCELGFLLCMECEKRGQKETELKFGRCVVYNLCHKICDHHEL